APPATSRRAVAAPSPDAPPVTSTTLLAICIRSSFDEPFRGLQHRRPMAMPDGSGYRISFARELEPDVGHRLTSRRRGRGTPRSDTKMDGLLQYWRALVRSDDSLPLFEAALAIAQDEYPQLSMPDVLARVDGFALALRRRVSKLRQPIARIDALREHFADELGFRGNANDFHDPENSYLNRVIER